LNSVKICKHEFFLIYKSFPSLPFPSLAFFLKNKFLSKCDYKMFLNKKERKKRKMDVNINGQPAATLERLQGATKPEERVEIVTRLLNEMGLSEQWRTVADKFESEAAKVAKNDTNRFLDACGRRLIRGGKDGREAVLRLIKRTLSRY
jgi:hypothetical protein